MKISEAFPSKYLRAIDIVGKRISQIIERVDVEQMQDGDYKPVVYFQGKEKGVVLNKTNAATLAEEYGDDTSGWTGKSLILGTWKTKNPQGKIVDGILVSVLSKQAYAGKQAAPVKKSEDPAAFIADSIDDDIPF